MTTSVPAALPAVALVEHGVGLADPGRGAEVDAEVAGRLDHVGGIVSAAAATLTPSSVGSE